MRGVIIYNILFFNIILFWWVRYDHAAAVSDTFLNFVEQAGIKTKGNLMVQTAAAKVTSPIGSAGYMAEMQFKVKQAMKIPGFLGKLKLKNKERVLEKSGMRPDSANKYKVDGVCDVVRAGLAYATVAEIQATLEMLLACDDNQTTTLDSENTRALLLVDAGGGGSSGGSRSIVVVRIKNRFADATSGGWSDIMINFYFADDPNKCGCCALLLLLLLLLLHFSFCILEVEDAAWALRPPPSVYFRGRTLQLTALLTCTIPTTPQPCIKGTWSSCSWCTKG